jgi:threonine dehydrogenase-like Zn-dependent dehydrogenase
MSSHKLAMQGEKHKRIRHDLKKQQPIIGHEFCGTIEEVGAKWAGQFKPGDKFAIQPALNYPDADGLPTLWAPGYSYEYIGGDATFIIIPKEVMEMNCLLEYHADNFYMGSLAEPVSCVVGAFHAQYHTRSGSYIHSMGIAEGSAMALLAGVGPIGLGAIDYAIHNSRKPSRLVVTDIDDKRLARASQLLSPEEAKMNGVELTYVNAKEFTDPVDHLRSLNGGKLYDDIFVFAPVKPVLEMGDALLARDGCLNFFAGPTDTAFSANFNFYNVHYESHHIVGTSGGNTDDMNESLVMMAEGRLNPVFMITHIGGLDAAAKATIDLDKIPGGKKLIYTHKRLPLTAIDDFETLGKTDPFFAKLAEICGRHGNLWNVEAENYLLENAAEI